MFVNCPSCRGLVATDPASDLPPERCPRCAAPLRDLPGGGAAPVDDARSGVAAAISEAFDGPATTPGNPAEDGAAQSAISLAMLLQVPAQPHPGPEPGQAPGPGPAGVRDALAEQATIPAPQAPAEADGDAVAGAAEQVVEGAAGLEAGVAAGEEAGIDPADSASMPVQGAARDPGPRPRRVTGRSAPSFARTRRAAAPGARPDRHWAMPAAILVLVLLLALQWLLADRARLAADPGWRPVVARVCGLLQCSLPPWRESAAFVLLERDVRPHPQAANALRIAASFRNDAAWPQAWPEIVLTLSDIDGRPLGMRAFTAAEYLGSAPPSDLLGSGQGAMIRMDVLEPVPGAVGFAFDFRDGPRPMAGVRTAR